MRINQFFSRYGICSKRQADRMIRHERVSVNGQLAYLGMQVSERDDFCIDGQPIGLQKPQPWFVLFYKPRGVVTTKAPDVENHLSAALESYGLQLPQHWLPVGRLDKDSEGLLLLTNQGQFAEGLLKSSSKQPKSYIVCLDKAITYSEIQTLASGIELDGEQTLPCTVNRLGENLIQMTLLQGLHRQIRRMCASLGLKVTRLQRVEFSGLSITGLASGQWRFLTEDEINRLQNLLGK